MTNKTVQEQYQAILEGKGDKDFFMKSVRRIFPDYISKFTDYKNAVSILKGKSILSENKVTTPVKKVNFFDKFKESMLKEAKGPKDAKVEEKEPTKDVVKSETENFDFKDTKDITNLPLQQILKGFYAEIQDPKNKDKSGDEVRDIVVKNLSKDVCYYTKDGVFGLKGVGYTDKAPGLTKSKDVKGKFKSSGYGDGKDEGVIEGAIDSKATSRTVNLKAPILKEDKMPLLMDLLKENVEEESFEDFIQSHGGNEKALKFKTPEDVENEVEKIREDFNLLDSTSLYDEAAGKFEEIYGINPMELIQFLGDKKWKNFKFRSDDIDESKDNISTKWDKLSDEEKLEKLLSVFKDPDEAEHYLHTKWNDIPDSARSNIKLDENERAPKDDVVGSGEESKERSEEPMDSIDKLHELINNEEFCREAGILDLPIDERLEYLIDNFNEEDINQQYEEVFGKDLNESHNYDEIEALENELENCTDPERAAEIEAKLKVLQGGLNEGVDKGKELSTEEVDAIYDEFPEIEQPNYKGKKKLEDGDKEKEEVILQITLPNNKKYIVCSNPHGDDKWYETKDNEDDFQGDIFESKISFKDLLK